MMGTVGLRGEDRDGKSAGSACAELAASARTVARRGKAVRALARACAAGMAWFAFMLCAGLALLCTAQPWMALAEEPLEAGSTGVSLGSLDYISSVDFGDGAYSTSDAFMLRVTLKSAPGAAVNLYDAHTREALGTMTSRTEDVAVQADRDYRVVATTLASLEGVSDDELEAFSAKFGHDARADISKLSHWLFVKQCGIEDVGIGLMPSFAHTQVSTESRVTVPDADAIGLGELYVRTAYRDPVTGEERRAASAGKSELSGIKSTVWRVVCTGLRPNTSYKPGLYAVYRIGGREVASSPVVCDVKTDALAPATVKATRISAKKVRVTATVPVSERLAGTFALDVYAGAKKVKTLAVSKAATYAFACTTAGAGKLAYKAVLRWKADASVLKESPAVKPSVNRKSYAYPTSASGYDSGECAWRPLLVSYAPKGKLRVRCVWVNNQFALGKAKSGFKVKVTFKCQGKKIATQVFSSKQMKRMTAKKQTLTFKRAKKGYDLANGDLTWTAKVTKTF